MLFGEVAHDMYLIRRGRFNVIDKYGRHVRVLNDGDFFGELAMIAKDPYRTMTVKSVGYSDALALSREVVLRVLNDPSCPDFRAPVDTNFSLIAASFVFQSKHCQLVYLWRPNSRYTCQSGDAKARFS